nr:hypothetical protein MIMGU_mgv11b0181731mg [Ipomoea batatas]
MKMIEPYRRFVHENTQGMSSYINEELDRIRKEDEKAKERRLITNRDSGKAPCIASSVSSIISPPSLLISSGSTQLPPTFAIIAPPFRSFRFRFFHRVADVDVEAVWVFVLELVEIEVGFGDGDDGRVQFPAVEDGGRNGGESGEDVVVGGGGGLEEIGDAVDVPRRVEEEESGAGQGVVGGSGDLEDPDVVVAGFVFGQNFHVVEWDAVGMIGDGEASRVGKKGKTGPWWIDKFMALAQDVV